MCEEALAARRINESMVYKEVLNSARRFLESAMRGHSSTTSSNPLADTHNLNIAMEVITKAGWSDLSMEDRGKFLARIFAVVDLWAPMNGLSPAQLMDITHARRFWDAFMHMGAAGRYQEVMKGDDDPDFDV